MNFRIFIVDRKIRYAENLTIRIGKIKIKRVYNIIYMLVGTNIFYLVLFIYFNNIILNDFFRHIICTFIKSLDRPKIALLKHYKCGILNKI